MCAGLSLPYTQAGFALECVLLGLYILIEPIRLSLATWGNRSGVAIPLYTSIGLGCIVTVYYAFQLALQSFVLKIDLALAGAGLCFVGSQLILSVLTVLGFSLA